MMNKQAQGALWGAAVGDALGTTVEFSRPEAATRVVFPDQLTGPLTDVVGGGPFNVDVGQVTDDTQMAVALHRSILRCGGFNADDVAKSYFQWRRDAFDIGGQTSGALSNVQYCVPGAAYAAGYRSWDAGGRRAAGNGSLMRTSPIGVNFAHDPDLVIENSVLDSAITHADPRCMLSCAAYNAVIADNIREEGKSPIYRLFTVAEQAAREARFFIEDHTVMKHWYTEEELDSAMRDILVDLDLAFWPDPDLGSLIHNSAGFVRTAFRYAFWCLAHAVDYRSALIGVVNMGGDSDTNGAIVGGLLGSYFGYDDIPTEWVAKCRTACEPGSTHRRAGGVWWNDFHPRYFDYETADEPRVVESAPKADTLAQIAAEYEKIEHQQLTDTSTEGD